MADTEGHVAKYFKRTNRRTDGQTDTRRTTGDQKSSGELIIELQVRVLRWMCDVKYARNHSVSILKCPL
jgi:hypothetical protein